VRIVCRIRGYKRGARRNPETALYVYTCDNNNTPSLPLSVTQKTVSTTAFVRFLVSTLPRTNYFQ